MDSIIVDFARQLPAGVNTVLTVILCVVVWRLDKKLQLVAMQLKVLIQGSHIDLMRQSGD